MSRSIMLVAIAGMFTSCADQEAPQSGLVGTWTKQYTESIEHLFPADTDWSLEVNFKPDGRFVWHFSRTDAGQQIDESLTGTYTTEGCLITYRFDKLSDAAAKRVEEWFAYWPTQLKGQQTFKFRQNELILGHDGHKLWFHMKRKKA